jgi:hypothetical protein
LPLLTAEEHPVEEVGSVFFPLLATPIAVGYAPFCHSINNV